MLTIKTVQIPWEGDTANLTVYTDNTEIIKGQQAILQVAVNKILLASVSHEYRTPLNAINFCAQEIKKHLAKDPIQVPLCQKYLGTIMISVDLLMSLIDDILDNSKLDRNDLVLNSDEFSLNTLFEELKGLFDIQSKGKGVQIIYEKASTEHNEVTQDLLIKADRKRIKQIMINLLSNSLKFTEHGFIKYSCRLKPFGLLEFKVEDSGYGISDADKANLFKEFGIGSQNRDKNPNGTGLGLSICKKLVIAMGGEINVESQIGKGTTFTFFIEP
jgi:two-component system, sensor histidine kinase